MPSKKLKQHDATEMASLLNSQISIRYNQEMSHTKEIVSYQEHLVAEKKLHEYFVMKLFI